VWVGKDRFGKHSPFWWFRVPQKLKYNIKKMKKT